MKILVTGGAGYIGSHTVVELHEAGYEPVIIDNYSNSSPEVIGQIEKIIGAPVKTHEGDCRSEADLRRVFEAEGNIAGVIHFAAYKAVGESVEEPLKYFDNNVGSMIALMNVMQELNIKPLVFSSSCTVYGQPDQLPVDELAPTKTAESPYGYTKQVCEQIIADMIRGEKPLKAVTLRYFNPIGAHPSALIGELPIGRPNNLLPFITQTAAGIRDALTVFGSDYNTPDGTCIRDYIHVVDLAKAHVKALGWLMEQGSDSMNEVFNLGQGRGDSVLEVVEAFERINSLKLNYRMGPRRSGDVEQIFANADKANKLLNWKCELGIDDAVADAWRWQQTL